MLKAFVRFNDTIRHLPSSLHRDERGQDAFEYLLVVGGISVAVIVAVATPVGGSVANAVLSGMCSAIATIPSMSAVSC